MGKGVLLVAPCPLQHPILEFLRIPTKLSLLEEINCACMVSVVLQNELLPWKREKVTEGVSEVLLPRVWWEGGSVHHVVIDVDVLNGKVCKGRSKDQCAHPEVG